MHHPTAAVGMLEISERPDIIPVNGRNISAHIDLWFADLENRELSDRTISNYHHQIRPFLLWWHEYGGQQGWALEPDSLKHFGAWLRKEYQTPRGTRLNANSRETTCRRLRQFFRWLYIERRLPIDITSWVPSPKRQPTKQHKLTLSDLAALLTAAHQGRNPVRDQAIIGFIAGTGARRAEVWSAQIEDIKLHADCSGSCYLRRTKADKPRTIIFGRVTGQLLTRHLDENGRINGPLFDFVTPDSIRLVINRLGDRAGLENVSPHQLRKLFSSYWYAHYPDDRRADFMLRLLLGHAPRNVTEKHYLLLTTEDARPVFVSPMESPDIVGRIANQAKTI